MIDIKEVTYQLLVEKNLTYLDSQRYVDWAVTLLENGYESESLVILAGLDFHETEEIEKYFWKSVEELNIEIEKIDFEDIENYAIFVAKQVVEERISPEVGFNRMLDIVRATDYSPEYMQFYYLDEDLDYLKYSETAMFNRGLTLGNKDEYIKKEFKTFYNFIRQKK